MRLLDRIFKKCTPWVMFAVAAAASVHAQQRGAEEFQGSFVPEGYSPYRSSSGSAGSYTPATGGAEMLPRTVPPYPQVPPGALPSTGGWGGVGVLPGWGGVYPQYPLSVAPLGIYPLGGLVNPFSTFTWPGVVPFGW